MFLEDREWTSDLQPKDQGLLTKRDFSLNIYDNQLVLYGGMGPSGSSSSSELWFFRLSMLY